VTTKEYHPHLCIDYVDFMARYKCNYIYIYIYMVPPDQSSLYKDKLKNSMQILNEIALLVPII